MLLLSEVSFLIKGYKNSKCVVLLEAVRECDFLKTPETLEDDTDKIKIHLPWTVKTRKYFSKGMLKIYYNLRKQNDLHVQ